MILAVLEQDIPGLSARVKAMDRGQRLVLAQAATQLALRITPVDDPRLSRAQDALGRPGVDPAIGHDLQALVDELDDEAAAAQIELDHLQENVGDRDREPALLARYERAFARARACEAVVAALEPDLDEAVGGALYEANAALDHSPATIGVLVESVANGDGDPVGAAVAHWIGR
jgi:hypothetical protein